MMGKMEKQGNRKRTFSGCLTSSNNDDVQVLLTPPGRVNPIPGFQTNQINLGSPSTLINQNSSSYLNSFLATPLPPPPPPLPLIYPNYSLLSHPHYFMEPTLLMDPLQTQFSLMGLNQSSPCTQVTGGQSPSSRINLPRKSSLHPQSEPTSKVAHIGVFWDIENCGVPRGKSAMVVVQMIRDRFYQPNYVEAEFVTVCDIRKESPQVIQELNDAQVTVIHVSGISKNAADDKLRQAMRRYADAYSLVGRSVEYSQTHGTPAILLISGDVNFASDLSDLRHRKRLNVILLHNPHAPEPLLACAHEHHNFHAGLEGIPIRGEGGVGTGNGLYGGDVSINQINFHDVVVIGLPPGTTKGKMNQLKTRLKRLSDNCGGKVAQVGNQQAVIRFNSREAALRAAKRMDGEDVLGFKIRTLCCNSFGIYSTPSSHGHGHGKSTTVPPAHQTQPSVGQGHNFPIPTPSGPPVPGTSSEWNMWTSPSIIQNTPQGKRVLLTPKKKQINPSPSSKPTKPTGGEGIPPIKTITHLPELRNSVSPSPNGDENGRETSEEATTTDSNGTEEELVSLTETMKTPLPPLVEISKCSEDDGSVGGSSSSGSYSSTSEDTSSNPPTTTTNTQHVPPPTVTPPRVNLIHVVTDFESFGSRVVGILSEEGTLELGQFLTHYASLHGSLTQVDEEKGVPVEHLLHAVKGVRIQSNPDGTREVRKVKDEFMEQSDDKSRAQLRVEIVNLLKSFPRCTIPLGELPKAYASHYWKELEVDEDEDEDVGVGVEYPILSILGRPVHLMGKDPDVYLTLTHHVQMKRFAVDMFRVLKSMERKEVSLEGFGDAFFRVTGRVFEAGDYGLCSLRDLLKELIPRTSHITLLTHGDEMRLKLV